MSIKKKTDIYFDEKEYYKERKPWERKRGEGEKAFRYFCIYKDLGNERSVSKCAAIVGHSKQYCFELSYKWSWKERAREWDNEVQNQANAVLIKQVKEMNKRHAKIAIAAITPMIEIVSEINKRVAGKKVLEELDFGDLFNKFIDTMKLMPNLINVERKARGEATEITKSDVTSNQLVVIKPKIDDDEEDEKSQENVNYSDDESNYLEKNGF